MVSVSSTENSISIILTAPGKWKRSPEEEFISLLQVYPGLQYYVSVLNKKTKKQVSFDKAVEPHLLNLCSVLLECTWSVTARIKWGSNPYRRCCVIPVGRELWRSVVLSPTQSRISCELRWGCSGFLPSYILKTSKNGHCTACSAAWLSSSGKSVFYIQSEPLFFNLFTVSHSPTIWHCERWVEGDNPSPPSAPSAPVNTAQDGVGLLCCEGTLLARVQLAACPQSSSAELLPRQSVCWHCSRYIWWQSASFVTRCEHLHLSVSADLRFISINTVDEEEFSDQLQKHLFFCSCPPGTISVWPISEFLEKRHKVHIKKVTFCQKGY